jgi:hypothetical protein
LPQNSGRAKTQRLRHLQQDLDLEVTEPAPKLDFPDYEVADAGIEEVATD